jgi:hypothetical protein
MVEAFAEIVMPVLIPRDSSTAGHDMDFAFTRTNDWRIRNDPSGRHEETAGLPLWKEPVNGVLFHRTREWCQGPIFEASDVPFSLNVRSS